MLALIVLGVLCIFRTASETVGALAESASIFCRSGVLATDAATS